MFLSLSLFFLAVWEIENAIFSLKFSQASAWGEQQLLGARDAWRDHVMRR